MKIFTTSIVLLNLALALGVNAQSLTTHGGTFYVAGDRFTAQQSHIQIINTGASPLSVNVMRDDVNLASGHSAYFCWGVTCYPPTTYVSPTSATIAAGDTNVSFVGYLDPQGHSGVSVIAYSFYDQNNAADSVNVTYTYDITTGINELSSKATVSSAYPNPADGLTSISYYLPSVKDARLVFYNMLGSAVKEIKLTEKQSTLIITTSDLKSGVYFYSLIADGKSVSSKKLVVSHR